MKELKIFAGGEMLTTARRLAVSSPYSGEEVATTYLAGAPELEKAIEGAQNSAPAMKNLPSYKRYEILKYISDRLEANLDHHARILALEAAKPMRYAKGEVLRAAQTFRVAAEESKRLPGEYMSLDWTPAGAGKEGWIKYFPVGPVAGISPFNFPLNLAVHKIAPAIASGNPIVLKPARSTPLSVLELGKIIAQTDLPQGAVSLLPMDRESGNQLVTDPRFKMLTFTGSPDVGWKMKTEAGKKKVALELGGNAGVIVTETADLNHAIARNLIGGFAYSGQVCIHVQRIFVQRTVFDKFAEQFVQAVQQLKTGDPLDEATEVSVMIDKNNAQRVQAWVDEALNDGAKILCGGKQKDTFFEPTVLTNTASDMKVCALEVFGPVVTLEPFGTFEEALYHINNSEYGLQAGVFTNRLDEMNRAFSELEVGGVIINDVPTFRVDHMPYGGVKNSGLGREGLKYSIKEMLEPRLLVKNF